MLNDARGVRKPDADQPNDDLSSNHGSTVPQHVGGDVVSSPARTTHGPARHGSLARLGLRAGLVPVVTGYVFGKSTNFAKRMIMSTAANPSPSNDQEPRSTSVGGPSSASTSEVEPATAPLTRKEVVGRQKERFGGMKFGAAFFGWLTASGTAVLLTALLAAVGAAIGLGGNVQVPDPTTESAQTIGLLGAIVLLAVTLIAYFAGGYVAGRMARFNGLKQGVGVWLWAVIAAVVFAILSLLAGAQFNLLGALSGLPRIPINEGTLTTAGVLTAVAVVVVALIGAMLGGIVGMRYHRKIDAVGLDR